MIHLPNWLIVYGTNRNSGKTSLITRIISQFKQDISIFAIKISPHFHPLDDQDVIVEKKDEYVIVRETRTGSGKDSSRMMEAGAAEVFYIQVWDNDLEKVIPQILEIIKPGSAVICESGWARNLIKPGIFLILNRLDNPEMKTSAATLIPLADRWIEFDGKDHDFDCNELSFEDGAWKLKS